MSTNSVLVPWRRTIRLGGFHNAEELRKALADKQIRLWGTAKDVLTQSSLATSIQMADVDLEEVSVEELGFPNGEIFSRICTSVSESGYELCTTETAPQLALQEEGECGVARTIGMASVLDSTNFHCILVVGRVGADQGGYRYIRGIHHPNGFFCGKDDRFVLKRSCRE